MGEERSSDLTDSPRHELKGPGERNIALSELNMKTSKREKKDEIFKKTKSSGEIINTRSDDGLSEKSLTLSVLDESVGDAISLDHGKQSRKQILVISLLQQAVIYHQLH